MNECRANETRILSSLATTKNEETRAFNALNSKTTLETRDPKWQKKQTGLQARGGQSQALFIPVSEETEQHSRLIRNANLAPHIVSRERRPPISLRSECQLYTN